MPMFTIPSALSLHVSRISFILTGEITASCIGRLGSDPCFGGAGSCWRLVHTPMCSLFGGLPKNKEYNTRYESPRKLGRCQTAFRVSLANVSTLSSSHSLVQGSDGLQRCKAWHVMCDVCRASRWSGLHAGPKECMVECTSAETLPACISTFPRPTASGWMDGRKMEKQSKLCVI